MAFEQREMVQAAWRAVNAHGADGRLVWLLQIAVVLTCVGQAAAVFRGDGSAINAFLFLESGLEHETAAKLERFAVGAVLLLSLVSLVWRKWMVQIPIAAYFFGECLAAWHQGGFPFSSLSLPAKATTYLTPLALALLMAKAGPAWLGVTANCILRLGLVSVFTVHGLEAFFLHPRFIDLILGSAFSLTGLRLEEQTAISLLRAIGVIDLVIAGALLIKPWRIVLCWMAFWAGLAALSRVTSLGWGAYPEVLIRTTFILAPIGIILSLRRGAQRCRAVNPRPEHLRFSAPT